MESCKQRIELIANTLQLEGFSRIDAFVNVDSGEVRATFIITFSFSFVRSLTRATKNVFPIFNDAKHLDGWMHFFNLPYTCTCFDFRS